MTTAGASDGDGGAQTLAAMLSWGRRTGAARKDQASVEQTG